LDAYIEAVGSFVPARRMHNDELAQLVNTSDEWIFSHTGIRYRHVAGEEEAASDLGIEASRRALKRSEVSGADVDMVLLATSTPDYLGLPSTACVVQDAVGAEHASAMDLMAACTGFIYALETARVYIKAGAARNILVVGSEVYSKIVNWRDRSTCVLFGDGAGAVMVRATESQQSRIVDGFLRSKGDGAEALCRPDGGTRRPYVEQKTEESQLYLYMNGRRVYSFAVPAVIETIETLLERNGLTFDDVRWVVPHQANIRIIEAACKRAGFPFEKFYMNIQEYANTSAASIPIALDEMIGKELLRRGDVLLTVGFGAGLTFGGNVIYW
jgi:3-oxoacyl-[acyl-carrier-protein] synthase-3